MDTSAHPNECQELTDLPQCKIKRNYSCSRCSYFTQNPRFYLTHLRDVHGERITISKCSLCLYASRHYQKLVRHMKMVHGSTSEDIPGQSRKRPLIEDVVSDFPSIQMPPLPTPSKWIMDIDHLSYDLKSSRKTLKDFAAVYFAQNDIDQILTKMEESDVVEVVPILDELPSIGISTQKVFDDPKCVGDKDLQINCPCGYVSNGFFDLVYHGKSCSESNKTNYDSAPLDLSVSWSNDEVVSSTPKKKDDSKKYHYHGVSKNDDEELDKNDLGSCNNDSKKLENKLAVEETKTELQNELTNIETITKEEIKTSHKKVFKCPLCPFWASTASRFHVHIVGHQNKKQFKCSMCAYCSNWRWDITKHIRLRAIRGITHKNARVLMLGENVSRNYTKYDRFITLMKISDQDDDFKLKKCGEMTSNDVNSKVASCEENKKQSKETFNEEIKLKEKRQKIEKGQIRSQSISRTTSKQCHPRSYVVLEHSDQPVYKCRKCPFRHSNRDAVLVHVKIHHQDLLTSSTTPSKLIKTSGGSYEDSKMTPSGELKKLSQNNTQPMSVDVENDNKAAISTSMNDSSPPKKSSTTPLVSPIKDSLKSNENVGGLIVNERTTNTNNDNYAPFRCWHCHQVSNWKHVIQRHCRLKHSGSIRIEAIDRSTDANNPSYRMLNLSSSPPVTLLDEKQSDKKTEKPLNQIIKHENYSKDSEPELSTKLDNITLRESKKSQSKVKCSEKESLKFECDDSGIVCTNIHLLGKQKSQKSTVTPGEKNEMSGKLQKCHYCSFASSCHSAMKCHEQSHYRVLKQKDSQTSKLNTIKGADGKISSNSEQTKIVTAKTDQLTAKNVNIEMAMKESIGNIKDSEANEMTKIQLKIKHSKASTNLNNYKKTSSLAAKSTPKTIFVNPKTGQVVRRN